MTARYRNNPGHRPSGIEDSDRIAVRFTYPDGTIREREVGVKGLYWGKDRPVWFDEWRRV